MAALLPGETFKQYYLNLYLTLIDDPVAAVRNSACKSFAQICFTMEPDAETFAFLKTKLQ